MLQSELTHLFLNHWQNLRRGADIPRTEDYFDNIDARIAPIVVMFECTGEDVIIRFQGTAVVQRWGADRTGQSWITSKPQAVRQIVLDNMNDCVAHPCGVQSKSMFYSKFGHASKLESLTLPLAVEAGRAKRLLMLSNVEAKFDERDGPKERIDKDELDCSTLASACRRALFASTQKTSVAKTRAAGTAKSHPPRWLTQ